MCFIPVALNKVKELKDYYFLLAIETFQELLVNYLGEQDIIMPFISRRHVCKVLCDLYRFLEVSELFREVMSLMEEKYLCFLSCYLVSEHNQQTFSF